MIRLVLRAQPPIAQDDGALRENVMVCALGASGGAFGLEVAPIRCSMRAPGARAWQGPNGVAERIVAWLSTGDREHSASYRGLSAAEPQRLPRRQEEPDLMRLRDPAL